MNDVKKYDRKNVQIPADLHRRIKVAGASVGKSIYQVIIEAFDLWLKENDKSE